MLAGTDIPGDGETVLAGTDIPGGGRRGRLYWRGPTSREVGEEGDCTGGDRHPGRWEKRETVLAGTDITGGGGRGRLYWRGPTSREVREGRTVPNATLSPPQ